MKRIKFSVSFFEAGAEKFKAGEHYPADDPEALRCIARGIAEEVEVPDEPDAEAPTDDAPFVDKKPTKAKK